MKLRHQNPLARTSKPVKVDSTEPIAEGISRTLRGRKWNRMDRVEILAYAKAFIVKWDVKGRKELEKLDSGLYGVLRRRGLLDEVGLSVKKRSWAGIENEKLIALARDFIARQGITDRDGLKDADGGLYHVLKLRKLLGKVGLSLKQRNWRENGDEQLLAIAEGFIRKTGISSRVELREADLGLYMALCRGRLLDSIGLPDSRGLIRNWAEMGDEQLIAYAKELIFKKGIDGRVDLEKVDRRLYDALKRRNLRDVVFSELEQSRHAEAVDGVLGALESFGDSK